MNQNPVFQLSHVDYQYDLRYAGSKTLRLGYFAEILIPKVVWGFGIIAIKELAANEMSEMGELAKRQLFRPFDYLSESADEVWASVKPGNAIAELANAHKFSLNISDPEILPLPIELDRHIAKGFKRDELEPLLVFSLSTQLSKVSGNLGVKKQKVELDEAA